MKQKNELKKLILKSCRGYSRVEYYVNMAYRDEKTLAMVIIMCYSNVSVYYFTKRAHNLLTNPKICLLYKHTDVHFGNNLNKLLSTFTDLITMINDITYYSMTKLMFILILAFIYVVYVCYSEIKYKKHAN